MADVAITATNVVADSSAQVAPGVLGETVTAGMVVYKKPSDNLWYKADALTAEKAGSGQAYNIKIALSGGSVGQRITLLEPGQEYTVGGTVVPGRTYVVSKTATSGAISPETDLVATNLYTVLGYAISTTKIKFNPNPTGL